MEHLTIRRACEADASELIAYLNAAGAESDNLLFGAEGCGFDAAQGARFIASMQASNNSAMLLGLDQEKVIAVCTLQGGFRPRVAHRAELAISVSRAYWSQGVGTAMLSAAIAQARQMRLRVLELAVCEDNVRAIRLYTRMGFQTIGRFPEYLCVDGKRADALLMNLYL